MVLLGVVEVLVFISTICWISSTTSVVISIKEQSVAFCSVGCIVMDVLCGPSINGWVIRELLASNVLRRNK